MFLGALLWAVLLYPPTCGQAGYAPVDPKQIEDIISQMTLREKLATTGIPTVAETDFLELKFNPLDLGKLVQWPHGESWFDLPDHERLELRGIRTRDGTRGITCLVGRNYVVTPPCPPDGSTPAFPNPSLRAATWDTALEEEFGAATGEIARLLDVHAALLPCINIHAWLNAGRSQESYGEDPLLNGKMGAATVRGIQSKGVMATPKHFLANNIENTRWMVSAEMDDKLLHEVYLKKWAILVAESSPEFIMTSYNRVQGNWSNINPKFIGLLREKLGFQGSIMTDWMATVTIAPAMLPGSPFKGQGGFFGALNSALVAGVDMEMPFNSRHIQAIRQLAKCGASDAVMCQTANMLDRAVGHLIRSKIRYGLAGPTRHKPKSETIAKYNETRYTALALKLAHRGIVLLRNEDAFLPKRPAGVRSVVVMGSPEVQELGDRGSSAQKPSGRVLTLLDGLNAKYTSAKVEHLPFDQATSKAVQEADMVVLDVGLNHTSEGEFLPPSTAGDRVNLTLLPHDVKLILDAASMSKNVIVAMTSGTNIVVEDFADRVKAILWLGYPGPVGGEALVDILAGDVNPSGRMTSATPRRPEDWVPEGVTIEPYRGATVQYPYAHGYKHMWGASIEPRYPMGWGLSYTSYSFGMPTLSASSSEITLEPTVHVQVTNDGRRAGIETVQVYATCTSCKQERLAILLVGFRKVELDAGETKEVSVVVSAKELAIYDAPAGMWLLEKGTYSLLIGPYADREVLQAIDYAVAQDFVFDYTGAMTKPHVPGLGERDCSTYRCVPDEDFNRAESEKALLARIVILGFMSLGLLAVCSCCWACRRCCRTFCCKQKAKGDKIE